MSLVNALTIKYHDRFQNELNQDQTDFEKFKTLWQTRFNYLNKSKNLDITNFNEEYSDSNYAVVKNNEQIAFIKNNKIIKLEKSRFDIVKVELWHQSGDPNKTGMLPVELPHSHKSVDEKAYVIETRKDIKFLITTEFKDKPSSESNYDIAKCEIFNINKDTLKTKFDSFASRMHNFNPCITRKPLVISPKKYHQDLTFRIENYSLTGVNNCFALAKAFPEKVGSIFYVPNENDFLIEDLELRKKHCSELIW